MRKFISRAAALLLAGVMTAAVAGCGKNSDSEAKDTAKKWTELAAQFRQCLGEIEGQLAFAAARLAQENNIAAGSHIQ